MKESNEDMNMNLLEDERITSFLKGHMDKEEEALFIQELNDNPELKAKAIAIARLVKGLKQVGHQRDSKIKNAILASTENDVKEVAYNITHKKNSKLFSLRRMSVWLSTAASVAIISWLGIGYYNYRQTTGLGDEYANSFESSMLTRGAETSTDIENKLQLLFEHVKEGKDLDNTIHELNLCWELSTMETYNDYTDYFSEIGYNLAIGHLKDNEREESIKVLKKLIELTDNNSSIHKSSQELLNRIENL